MTAVNTSNQRGEMGSTYTVILKPSHGRPQIPLLIEDDLDLLTGRRATQHLASLFGLWAPPSDSSFLFYKK